MKLTAVKWNEFVAKLNPKQRLLFTIAAGMVVTAMIDRIVMGPILAQLKVIDSKIEAKEDAIRRDRRIVSFEKRIVEEYTNYGQYLDTGEFKREEIVSALLKKIENLAAQHKITIKSVQPGDVEEKPLFQIYKTTIDAEGTLQDMLLFMNELEQSDYLFQITRYEIGPKSKGADLVKCALDISRTLITREDVGPLPEKPAAPAPEAGLLPASPEPEPPASPVEELPASGLSPAASPPEPATKAHEFAAKAKTTPAET